MIIYLRPPGSLRACGLFDRGSAPGDLTSETVAWMLRDLGVYTIRLSDDTPGFGLVHVRGHTPNGSPAPRIGDRLGGRGLSPLEPRDATIFVRRTMSHPDLAGKAAIVTGAGAGIGLAVAERLAAEGCKVCARTSTAIPPISPQPRSVAAQSGMPSMSATSNR